MIEEKILFEDKDVKITNEALIIKCYYFPIGTSKIIPFKDIQRFQVRPLGMAKMRLWGMDAMQWGYWFPGDRSRCAREQFIAVYNGKSIVPSFTTENTGIVYNILESQLKKLRESFYHKENPITGVFIQNNSIDKNSIERPMLYQ